VPDLNVDRETGLDLAESGRVCTTRRAVGSDAIIKPLSSF